MTNFENLNEIKSQLFDAPTEVKTAFNTVCQYFDGKPKPTFEELIDGTAKQAISSSGKSDNDKVLKTVPGDYVYLEDNAIHRYINSHASKQEEVGDYVIYEYDGKKFIYLLNNLGYHPILGDKATLKAIWNKVH